MRAPSAVVLAAAVVSAFSQNALASDFGMPWTGWYAGVNVGGGWGRTNHTGTETPDATNFDLTTTGNFNTSGWVAGATAGYNFQIRQWLIGAETDLDWSNIRGTFNANPASGPLSASTQLNWLDTARIRVGWIWSRALFYGTAGAAFGGVTASASSLGNADPTDDFNRADTQVRFGWTAGGGVEYAFTDNLSAKVEYLFVNLGTQTQIDNDSVKFSTNMVRGGVNVRF
jgi:outer membrane immunogenic protein